ncbi:DoxX family protein [Streptomyces coryli]
MRKVPSDPALVALNNASFRVQLGPSSGHFGPSVGRRAPGRRQVTVAAGGAGAATVAMPVVSPVGEETAEMPAVPGARRRAPVVWSGRSTPGDPAAGQLLQAVRQSSRTAGDGTVNPDLTETQVLPRLESTVIGQRGPSGDDTQLLPPIQPGQDYPGDDGYDDYDDDYESEPPRRQRFGADPVRHAYYPGRRMNLGVVLLPLRIFLGLVSIYAGFGKLSDPAYFDGGERGSLAKWLGTLEPWAVAQPLYDLALTHPVGAGLTVAFLQVIVGVLTICGLWQRIAAGFGVLLSLALIVTVSWGAAPVYDAPDFIYLAAWSPLVIAGAPVYSMDARLAGQAWRRLGPRSELWELRRYVLRRGVVLATFVIGATLLLGAMLGGAVRSSKTVDVPEPGEAPRNQLPGSPLPETPGGDGRGGPAGSGSTAPSERPSRETSPSPSASPSAGRDASQPGNVGEQPSSPQGEQQPPAQQEQPSEQQPPAEGGGSTGGGGGGGSQDPGDEESPGLVGGLLG